MYNKPWGYYGRWLTNKIMQKAPPHTWDPPAAELKMSDMFKNQLANTFPVDGVVEFMEFFWAQRNKNTGWKTAGDLQRFTDCIPKRVKTCQPTNGGPGLAATGIYRHYLMRIQLTEEYKSESLVEIHCSECALKAKDENIIT